MKAIIITDINPQPIPKTFNFKDISNGKFGRLTVIAYASNLRWYCLCDCGNKIITLGRNLRFGTTTSCGCYQREAVKKANFTHGESHFYATPEYIAYYSAKSRCTAKEHRNFKNYGGRGIEFRFDSYEDFLKEVGRRPTKKHSLDRIETNGHYEVGNIRWATNGEQARNKNNNVKMTIDGVTKIMTVWCELYNIKYMLVWDRKMRRGWCDKCAVTVAPYGKCSHHFR